MNNTFTCPEQNRPSLLISGLRLDKAHFRLTGRNDNCLGIGGIVLLALYEREHICGAISLTA